jgi:hypothetical protein
MQSTTFTKEVMAQITADNHAVSRAAALASGPHGFSGAVRLVAGDDVFGDAVRRMHEFERGAHPSVERAERGVLAGVPAAAPAGTPLMAPAPSASAAQDLLNRCADAAEKVHGTGKYART